MPTLTIITENGAQKFSFAIGQSLRQILNNCQLPVRSACVGLGACGLCHVQIIEGNGGEPYPNEYFFVSPEQMSKGVRLACQVKPGQDLTIKIVAPAPKSSWKRLDHQIENPNINFAAFPPGYFPFEVIRPYGVAVDLGTTNISLTMYDLRTGARVAGRFGQNPQAVFGPDIISRLVNALESEEQARILRQKAIDAICEALWEIALLEGINLNHVVRLTLVGNTAMLALLSGRNFDLLLQPKHWVNAIDCLPEDTTTLARAWGIHPQARIEILPPLAGFVGSDLLAGVFTTRLTDTPTPNLLIDFGTNSEIALWDGATLWCTSAAGGPAFEGSGIRAGMAAVDGAIHKINIQSDTLVCSVIGGGQPSGICGSGLVDLIACLVRMGTLSIKGKFLAMAPGQDFILKAGDQTFEISRADVDIFQRAKAAIGVGIYALLETAGINYRDLQRVCVCGAFGHSLNIVNAQMVGLLPGGEPGRVELCGNTALAGCEDLLLSPAIAEQMIALGKNTRIINLSQLPEFDLYYLENLFLLPFEEHE